MTARDSSQLVEVGPGGHVCWVVTEPHEYSEGGLAILQDAKRFRQLPVLFGPDGSTDLAVAAPLGAVVENPAVSAGLGERFDHERVLDLLRDRAKLAQTRGYSGPRMLADMDWLAALNPTREDIVGFEVLVDRLVVEVGATIVCGYRRSSFDKDTIGAALAVHGIAWADDAAASFQFTSAANGEWRLGGELDVAVTGVFWQP